MNRTDKIHIAFYRFLSQIASVTKFCHDGGLGISLEGTIDIQNGKEALPHHFINSILPNGPVGRNGLIKENDELLEVILCKWIVTRI